MLKIPFCSQSRHHAKALAHKIIRELDLCTKAEINLIPTSDLIEINPQLRLGKEYEFGALP